MKDWADNSMISKNIILLFEFQLNLLDVWSWPGFLLSLYVSLSMN